LPLNSVGGSPVAKSGTASSKAAELAEPVQALCVPARPAMPAAGIAVLRINAEMG
jgi:hypothetical protein